MNDKVPQHIAIVMDGNGRWAANKGLLRVEGHRAGVDSVNTIVQSCLNHGVGVLSLFAFSSENWSRPESEVACLMELFLQALNQEVEEMDKLGVSLRFTGDRGGLSVLLQEKMREAEARTANKKGLILNVGINYGGRWDIVQAAKKIANHVRDDNLPVEAISEALFSENLDSSGLPNPDLLIRTSGELRLSNFFLWQMAYTELYFTEVHWPDFNAREFEKALESYRHRERRYGKTSTQVNEITHV